ncbi:S-adenosyl-L-methionine-dependent methyltransferase [Dunaliella salina]|uniref:type I protein arginine methyltransferase n=1 Tax=Dunaliella salina TaxID=3046 RepID=A0ABQ7GN19_DUNSA|nr:S-adenosyl-L-methionine-dependent methyltransferase [Dunaliella salina]|eukprot:KAF5835998.1 S-adenosyl-L-methionine-dependent methyltransferase [Dunaliella salina]
MDSSSEDEDMQQGQEEWEEWEEGGGEEGEDSEPTPSLFEPALLLPSPLAAIEHDAQKHGFNLLTFILQAHLDEYDIIRVINYVRHEVKQGRNPLPLPPHPKTSDSSLGRAPWQDDKYLIPVLPEDPLLCFDFQEAVEQLRQQQQLEDPGSAHQAAAQPHDQQQQLERQQIRDLREENRLLRDENEALRELVLQLRLDVMPAELRLEEAERAGTRGMASASTATPPSSSLAAGTSAIPTMVGGSTGHGLAASQEGLPSSNQGGSNAAAVAESSAAANGGRAPAGQAARDEVDASYFDSYSGFNIHREMLSDQPRTNAYRMALEGNPSLISGKRVLDVGCGTGILSLFAARTGARSVVAIDGSPDIAKFAEQIADANGYSKRAGGPLEVVSARVEQLAQLPGGIDKVDVIVSEWMGYALLFETMLDSVLYARDKWLAPGGVVLPDMASIHLAGAGEGALSNGPAELSFWKSCSCVPDVTGVKMSRQHA